MKKEKVKKVIILGGGGHARSLKEALDICGQFNIIGFTDLKPVDIKGLIYLGNDSAIKGYSPQEIFLVNGIGSVTQPYKRRKIYDKFKSQGYNFLSVIHPKAIVSLESQLSEGVEVMAGVVINTGVVLGENVIINTSAVIDHDCRIGAHTHISPGVTLSGGVRIGDCSHIGSGATVIQGVNIGDEVIVGAGGVVVNDIPSKVTVVGIPAKIYKKKLKKT
ncbi:MAG: acetyltransferase [Candidatus Omnitrophica bacterium]|nr:acetyltransferase [Candidatus Omnitrophota bacterium]MDD5429929.1 acetyltransferase [Candidatus Omnitrophota bacterium]